MLNQEIKTIIKKYQLEKHPEGGFYKEIYRSDLKVKSPAVQYKERSSITDIYFLLAQGQISRFHRVIHDEIWNFYEGDPLKLITYNPQTNQLSEFILGKENGFYKTVIAGGVFQAAETTGLYSLMGCTVAPGFDFEDFIFLKECDEELKKILSISPTYQNYL